MDRQYASNINIGQLRKYAEEQGWVMWTDRGCFYDSERKEALKELDLLQVQLGEHTYKNFPYLDSLPYFDTTRNVLSAKMEDLLKPSKIYFLNGTSGLYSATLIYVADYLGVIRNRGDMLELHDGRFALGSECGPARGRNGNYLMTELVNVGGIYYHIDDAPEIVTYLGRNYTTDMCIRTSALTYYVGEDLWVPKTEVITHSGRTLIKSECVYRGDGLYHRTELINSVFDLSTGELVDGVPAEQTLYVQRLPFKVKGGLVTWPNGQICGGFAFVPAGTDVRPQDITGYIMECGVLIDTGLLPRDFTGRLNWEIKFYERRKKAADARDKRSQDSTQDPVAFSQLRENDCIPGAVGGPVGFVMYEGQAREPVCVGEEEEE